MRKVGHDMPDATSITAALRAAGFTGNALDVAALLLERQDEVNALTFGELHAVFRGGFVSLHRRDKIGEVERSNRATVDMTVT